MAIGFAIECVVLAGGTYALLGHYKDAQVGAVVTGTVFFSWYVGFLGLVLLPWDLTTTARGDADAYPTLLCAWQFVYWSTFVLSWVVLPVLIEYNQSGAFTTEQRLRYSIKYLLRHYAVLLVLGFLLFLYLVVVDHFSIGGVLGLVMTLGNTYGLLWIICLLGYGLVNIPRKVYAYSDPQLRLRQLYFRATYVHDERVEAQFVLDDVVREVRQLATRFKTIEAATIVVSPEFQYIKQCIDHLMGTVGLDSDVEAAKPLKRQTRSSYRSLAGPVLDDSLPTEKEIIHLHGRAKRVQADHRRCDQTWIDLCYDCQQLQLASRSPTPVVSMLAKALTCVCVLGSGIVMWSEVVMGAPEWLSPLRHLLGSTASTHIIVIGLLLYMALCTYMSLFSMRGSGRLALHGNHNSTELSLLTTSVHQSRLQFSLGYNFLLLLNASTLTSRTAFHALFTDMRLIHFFGTDFSMYAPTLLLVLATCTLLNGYARLVRYLGLDQYEELLDGHVEHDAKVHQGDALVQRGIEKYARQWAAKAAMTGSELAAPLLAANE
ncbi:hypothetical protein SPRG_03156 [Saprolegnia parasitica CBS 223.65]|uniref:LMBR1 domain-containing protein n=1 Tax=Saprolegnia parasitica (strain CBS 223.65) TaxID=695850 RepID=A0A067CRQ4_SAPPC|nr:hypothetical protein SPRG_03156 [Saprolegnia parasitica CBS 223.65]KDO31940.1 hypothetical protein SPRG_03156 [Saprolegnia parasitica CBS 223.65]|eukprot:XP_012197138.1 hypothetical protein SPRG_03156 [Saprolegnia parasitica CBS 223.65]